MQRIHSIRRRRFAERKNPAPCRRTGEWWSPNTALLEIVRLIPWTIISVVLIIIVASVNGTLHRTTSSAQLERWGTGLRALRDGHVWTIVTTNFLIDHPVAILSAVVLSVVATGSCELFFGTRRAVFAWFAGAWLPPLLALVLLLPAHLLQMRASIDRLMASEVGSSTATWCCAGVVVGFPLLAQGWRRLAGTLALIALLVILAIRPDYTSVEHLGTFVAGMAFVHCWHAQPGHIDTLTRAGAARLMSVTCGVLFLLELALTGISRESFALVPIGIVLILLSLFSTMDIDRALALLVLLGGILANLLEPNVATLLAVAIVLWLTLYRGRWTLSQVPIVDGA